ncbi:MAG: response regulator transcription factor [Anaerolineales bacterium]
MIRVLLVDDQLVVREGLRAMLAPEPDIVVVGEASDGEEAITAAHDTQPDVILLDVRMPRMDGLEALKQIKAVAPRSAVVMVTLYDNTDYLLRAVAQGAAGYVLKDSSRADLVEAVRLVADGGGLISPSLMPRLLREVSKLLAHEQVASLPLLSAREVEVLTLVAEGLSNQEIGDRLYVGAATVKTHLQNIMLKLGVSDRTQAAVRGMRLGLIH